MKKPNRRYRRLLEQRLKKGHGTSGLKLLSDGTLHAVRYIWYRPGEPTKSGIAREATYNQYNKHTLRTNAKSKVWALWDDNFLHQDLDYFQAADVISKMDSVFNQLMKHEGYRSRDIHSNKNIGTEFYEIENSDYDDQDHRDSIIEIIEATWKIAYKVAYEFVTKTELDPIKWINSEFMPREGQDYLFIDPMFEFFKTNDKGTGESHGGTGKTKMSFRISELICKHVLKNGWKLLVFSDNINNTVQQATEYSKFYRGQTGKRLTKSYIIGSPSQNNFNVLESWSTVISASDPNLVNILKDSFNSKSDCAFFVVNHSANNFLEAAKKAKIDFKKTFTVLDEIQQYSTENDQAVMIQSSKCAVLQEQYDDLFGKKLGLSATHIERPNNCTDRNAVFNDDIEKFGPKVCRIDEIKAREMGWICDKEALIVPILETPDYLTSVKENRPLSLTLKGKTINIDPRFFPAISALINQVIPSGKTHSLFLTPLIKNIKDLGSLFRTLQELGLLDEDIEIIEGYANCGASCVSKFNRSKRCIMIASRWVAVGQDTYNCDCIIPLYNPDSQAFKRQFSMRSDRYKGDRSSLLVIVEFASKLRDNMWFSIAENMSNGEIPRIISQASVFDSNEELDENVIDVSVSRTTTSNREIDGGGTITRSPNVNIVLPQANNRNPIIFESWELLANMIGTRKYTDKDGNSRFGEIASLKLSQIRAEKFIDDTIQKIKEGKTMLAHSDGKRVLYSDNLEYVKRYANEYSIDIKEAKNQLSKYISKIDDYREDIINEELEDLLF